MTEMTAGIMRQRYVDGHPMALDMTRIESVPTVLRDLAETWLRTVVVMPTIPGKAQLQGCADYESSLADIIDGALLSEDEQDASRGDVWTETECVACGDVEFCRPDSAGEPVCDGCFGTWEGQ